MKTALVSFVCALICLGAVEAGEPSRWEGQSADDVIAAWGEPTKTKRDGRGGKVLVYKLRFSGDETVGEGMIPWSDVGIGPFPVDSEDRHRDKHSFAGGPRIGGGQEVVGTQKVKFYVNRKGIVYRLDPGRFKWKTRPWSPAPPEAGPDPNGPEIQ